MFLISCVLSGKLCVLFMFISGESSAQENPLLGKSPGIRSSQTTVSWQRKHSARDALLASGARDSRI